MNYPGNGFLAGGGQMGERFRSFPWDSTRLGPPGKWPASLRAMVRMLLSTQHPVFIFWGEEHICLYNDAYSTSLGPEKHPIMLGQPGKAHWAEIWDVIGPQIERVLRGEAATWHENQLVPIIRHGELQRVYWTYSFGPIDEESAPHGVGGVLVLCTETTQQVLIQERLQGELRRFASLFEQAPAFMNVLSGPEHRYELVNPAYTTLLPGRALIGRTVAEAVPEAAEQGYVKILDQVLQTGQPFQATGAVLNPMGSNGVAQHKVLDFVLQPIKGELGQVTGILVIGVDMTERTAAQEALVRSEELLRLATDNGEIGFWDVDLVANKLFWPPRVRAMFGIFSDRIVSLDDFERGLHPLDRANTMAAFAASTDPAQRTHYEVEYRTVGLEDGVVRWVAAKGRGLFENDVCVRAVGTAVDITKQKRAEARLIELNEALGQRLSEYLAERKLLADIVDGTDAFVQVVDLQYRWLAINRASADEFERIFGARPRVGQSMLEILQSHPEQRDAVREVWGRALQGEEFMEVGEFGLSSLEKRSYEMRFRPLYDVSGARIGAYQFVYDVTERVANAKRLAIAEESLHQAQKMEALGQLTGGIAHDFNNLLQGLRSQFEVIRRAPSNTARVVDNAKRGIEATRRAARLTAQLLAFSRKHEVDHRAVNVNTLLGDLESLVRNVLGASLAISMPDVPPELHLLADATQLEMAMLNLAINARDAMPNGGTLGFSVREVEDGFVELGVSDTGEGMSSEVAGRAFDPFFTTKELGKGSGLGLSQVYGMAQRAGGSVTLSSEIGKGTTVTIRLKSEPAPHKAAPTAPTPHPEVATSSSPLRILLVEDNPDVRASVADMLTALGHRFAEAESGDQALEALNNPGFDLLLLDFAMPKMNGATLALLVRQKVPDIRIIFMSGHADLGAIESAIGQETHLLRKPFDISDLQEALRRLNKSSG